MFWFSGKLVFKFHFGGRNTHFLSLLFFYAETRWGLVWEVRMWFCSDCNKTYIFLFKKNTTTSFNKNFSFLKNGREILAFSSQSYSCLLRFFGRGSQVGGALRSRLPSCWMCAFHMCMCLFPAHYVTGIKHRSEDRGLPHTALAHDFSSFSFPSDSSPLLSCGKERLRVYHFDE